METFIRTEEKAPRIETVTPLCNKCGKPMRLAGISHHPHFPRVEIVVFDCRCGEEDRRVVPHKF
jgi:hypothetical protein